MAKGSTIKGSTIDDTLKRIESQPNVSTDDGWMRRWQKIEESMSKLRLKETSATNSVDSSSQVADSRKDPKDRTLLIKVRLELYPISWEILDKIFSRFGIIEYLEVFCRGAEYHSMIRFQKRESAMEAFESLNHRYIYDIWCRLELFLVAYAGSSSEIVADVEVGNRTSEFQGAPIEDEEDCQEKVDSPDSNANQMEESSVDVNQVEPPKLFLATSMESSSADQGNAALDEIEVVSPVAKNYIELEEDPNKLMRVKVIAYSIEDMNQVIKQHPQDLQIGSKSSMEVELRKTSKTNDDGDVEEPQTQQRQFELMGRGISC